MMRDSTKGLFDNSNSKKATDFIKNLNFGAIKECKDIQLLAEALILKLKNTVSAEIQNPDPVRNEIHEAPELGQLRAEQRVANKKFTEIMGILKTLFSKGSINQEQADLLTTYKKEFTGVGGAPSRTSAMFDQVLLLAPKMKGPTL